MEFNNNGISSNVEDEDRLSVLIDDLLLSILGRVDITTTVRTSVLSMRWKHLPWLLRELTVDAKDFLPIPQPNPIENEHMDEAMSSLDKAIRSFLATPRIEGAITRLQLKIYLISNYAFNIGPLVSEAIDTGILKDLNLAFLDEMEILDCTEERMLQQAGVARDFFSDYPSVFHCLTRLSLYNLCFAEWDINHHLFDCCQQLQHLYLSNCDAGRFRVWKIDAPDSKLSVLQLNMCVLGRLEIVCLPKLERLEWDTWLCPRAPLSFGVVPSLKELYLICGAVRHMQGFVLSEVLRDTTIHTMKLDFQGEKLWMQPEGKQPCTGFNKLRKLSVHGIFVDFNLLWMRVLLEAAPFLEMFDIEIWEHPCLINDSRQSFGERTNPLWKVPEITSRKNSFMKVLQIIGFKPLKQQIEFIRAVMQQAPNLATIVLKYDDPCEDCEKMGIFPPRSSSECVFPKNKDERDMVDKLLMVGVSSCAQIIFDN
ncbi:uncharacterized protein LOC133890561 isoform X5 [Phragmites australis]|uniref:uncharacterized protein LOC133890561 isoform X5 n=1 Tax=Phragmites australis TaxID=29695 RepID=UPI002D794070|nr:uncharacterized protein LOC133890561 isoform X5 [Phragmites australis]